MKTSLTMILIALMTLVSRATAQTIKCTVEDVEITANKTAELKVSLENAMDIAGWQLYLYLPEHIDIAYNEEDGERDYDNTVILSSRHLRSHTCTITATADGGYLIMAYNPSKPTCIKEHSGAIVTIKLQVSDGFEGQQAGKIKNVAVSDIDAVQTNVEGEMTFHITSPDDTAIALPGVSTNAIKQSVYHVNGRRAIKQDKGILVKQGQKYVAQ